MRARSVHSPAASETTALGRLGGLSPSEADRGEKALWLSGRGYRAALFHLGALTRLNELGVLAQTSTVGAVSGGSIIAALLATQIPWPLQGAYRDWPERVAEPMRAIARRNARARALLRRPFPGVAADAALEERYARELASSLGGESRWGPRFVFGASGLTLSGLAAGWEECLEWQIDSAAHPPGYEPELVVDTIAAVRTDLDAFGEAEQAVLENHGYLLADAALRRAGMASAAGIQIGPPDPPHPEWMAAEKVRAALASSSRRTPVGRLRPRRALNATRKSQPTSAELGELLERHRPVLQYDSLESCPADSVETICTLAVPGRCNTLHRADGTLIAAAAPAFGETRLDADFLGGPVYANGEQALPGDYLDECGGSRTSDATLARRQPGCADVVYSCARHDREGRLWLQYWFFHYFYDRGLLGVEQHEGDWEMAQFRLGDDGAPDEATLTQHRRAERLRWEELVLVEVEGGRVPVLYPARGSHACRPRPGTSLAPVVPDHTDGRGSRVRPRLVPIGDDGPGWVRWPGRWGSTQRREHFEADSPHGPREQPQWWDPAELHAEARPWHEGGGRARGDMLPPPDPRIEVHRDGEMAIVSYRFDRAAEGTAEPARIVVAPISSNNDPVPSHSFTVEGNRGSFAVALPATEVWTGMRAVAYSDRGVSGPTLEVPLEGEERAG